MEAKLTIRDVGGLRGEHAFSFRSGKLSYIEGSNTGGKSSVIRGLVAALSMPQDGDMSRFFQSESFRLGVRTDSPGAHEGFVNVLAKNASVNLVFGDNELEYVVDRSGDARKLPAGDPRFMLTGVLSNQSKILRQLRGQDERSEADDFRWAVTELSLASRYEEVLEMLRTRREDIDSKLAIAKQKTEASKSLAKERVGLEARRDVIDKELEGLTRRFESVRPILEKMEKMRKQRSMKAQQIAERQGLLSSIEERDKSDVARGKLLEKKAKAKRADYQAIDLEKLELEFQQESNNTREEVARLISERNDLDGELNLFVVAESSMDRKGATCPLCHKGRLSYQEVKSRLSELRKLKENRNARIAKLNMGIQQRRKETDRKKEEKAALKQAALDLEAETSRLAAKIGTRASRISGDREKIEHDKSELEKIDKEVARLSEQLGAEDKNAQKVLADKGGEFWKVSDKLADVVQQLAETQLEIGTVAMGPNAALRVLEEWKAYIDALIAYASSKAEDQRKLAARQFNETISDLMARLGFNEFRTVMLNAEYRLYVERYDERKKDYVYQQVRTLSTSEQMSIALILQMALKETYLPEVPFFILDDVMEDLDEDRRQTIAHYLGQKALEFDWFILSTKLARGLQGIRVV